MRFCVRGGSRLQYFAAKAVTIRPDRFITKTRERSKMQMEISLDDRLMKGINLNRFNQYVTECVIIRKYQNSELSLGEVKELLGLKNEEGTIHWLSQKGVATIKRMSPDLEKIAEAHTQKIIQSIHS